MDRTDMNGAEQQSAGSSFEDQLQAEIDRLAAGSEPPPVDATPDGQQQAPGADQQVQQQDGQPSGAAAASPTPEQQQAPAQQPGTQAAPQGDQPERMVPVSVAQALRHKAQEERDARIRLEGELNALRGQGQGQQAGQQQTPAAPVDPLVEVEGKIVALAESYDKGEISTADMKRQELSLMREREQILREQSQPTPEQVEDQIVHHPMVLNHQAKVEADNPWLANVPQDVLTGAALPLAYKLIEQKSIELNGSDPRSTMILREATVAACKMLKFDTSFGAAPAQQPPAQVQQPQQPAPQSGVTPEQRLHKLGLADQVPPNISGAGIPAGPSDAAPDYAAMSVHDLMKLPKDKIEQLAFGSG